MKVTRCTAKNQVCWFCSKEQRDICDRILEDNYSKCVRNPEVTKIIQRRLVWGN